MSLTVEVTPATRGLPAGLPRVLPVDRSVFPDGLRTSGQHPPVDSQLRPFEEFPQEITGSTVWEAHEMSDHPEKWVHRWTEQELEELKQAIDGFAAMKIPLTNMTKAHFRLPTLGPTIQAMRDQILNGIGFVVFRGLPIDQWGRYRCAVATMGVSAHFGYLLSQNKLGLLLGHITNQGADANDTHKIKISATNAPQFYHTDETDIVGLLFCAPAEKGGASGCVSVHRVWNALIKERPDVAKTLASPIWYFDRKGEITEGQEPWIKCPIFMLEPGGRGRLYVKWDPYYVKSLTRFSDQGLIPPLSAEQLEASDVLEEFCNRYGIVYDCEVGDMQFVSCCHTLHSRTGFIDAAPPKPKRYLLRTWISTPEHEGGWCLPYHDSFHPKRGGIQVDSTPPIADPLVTSGGT